MSVDYARLEALGRELLLAIGDDPDRPGLVDTPRRWASWWREFIEYEPGRTETCFESVRADQMVVVSGIRVWSLCEHHLLPFWCDISIGYITGEHVLGLSKFARIAHQHAHRLQLQEQLVTDIADHLCFLLGHSNVAVLGRGEHLCMSARGIRSSALMSTSDLRGVFRDDQRAREEFLALCQGRPHST